MYPMKLLPGEDRRSICFAFLFLPNKVGQSVPVSHDLAVDVVVLDIGGLRI